MKINIDVAPTAYFEGLKVSSLPEDIRNEILTLDKIMQNRNNTLLELEILEMAVNHKMLMIKQTLLKEGLLQKNETESAK